MHKSVFVLLLSIFFLTNLSSNTIHDFLDMANSNMVHQNYYGAIELYKEGLKLNPSDINCNKGLSDSFFMLGEYEEALIYIDKSIVLNSSDLELINSKGRILTALGNYEEADKQYKSVLNIEMYNVSAQSGLAELRIVEGDLKGSLYDFEKILKYSPNSRRLLLSLVVLYDNQKDRDKADEYIQKAIRYYPEDPIVLEAAVRHYMFNHSYNGAALYMDELDKLSDKKEIKLLNARLLIYLEDYDTALEILTEYMKLDKDNPESYYLATVILEKIEEKDRALSLIKRGMDLKPDEELYRFFSEMIMNEYYILKDQKRINYSTWYYNQGKLLEKKYFYEKAKIYYLRGMELNPFDKSIREAHAQILKKMGYRERYIKELDLLNSYESDESIVDTILIENSLPKSNLIQKWGSERWGENNLFSVTTFIDKSSMENHLNSSNIIKDITNRFLSGQNRFYTDTIELFSGSYSTAFNSARESNSDYFLLISYIEGSRTFSLKATLHLTKSGREIRNFSYLKTGNNRIFNCFENLSKDINDSFPIIGTVIDINGNDVLIDLGRDFIIKSDAIFDVVKKGSFILTPDKPYLSFDIDKHLGLVTINDIGEGMSDGSFTPDNSFNLLNIGDNVLYLERTQEDTSSKENSKFIFDRELIDQLLQVN